MLTRLSLAFRCEGRPAARAAALLALLLTAGHLQAAPKTDVVTLLNGDHVTGEVKELAQGVLRFKTDDMGTLSIEWDKIASLKSDQYLRVDMQDGTRYEGRAAQVGADRHLVITGNDGSGVREVAMGRIVRLASIDQGDLLDRLDGYATVGYDYTKSSGVQQLTLTGGISSRDVLREWAIDGATTLTTQPGQRDTRRYNVDGYNRRFMADRWFYQGLASVNGNQDLGVDLRATLGGAFGRYLVQTSRQELAAYAGAGVTQEYDVDQDGRTEVESLFGVQYSYFSFDTPEAKIDASLNVIPSLSQWGRVRGEADLTSSYEIVDDLFFAVTFYGSYDSEPPPAANAQSDFGVTTSLGYSF